MAILCNEFGYSSLLNRVETEAISETRDPLTHWSSLYRRSAHDGDQIPSAEEQQKEQAFLNATAVAELLSSTDGKGSLPDRVAMVSLFVLFNGAGGEVEEYEEDGQKKYRWKPDRVFGNMSLLDRTFLGPGESPDNSSPDTLFRTARFGCNQFDFMRMLGDTMKVWGCPCCNESRITQWSAPGCKKFDDGEQRQFERYAMKVLGAQASLLADKRFCPTDPSSIGTSGSSKADSSAAGTIENRVVAHSGVHVRSFVRRSLPEFFTHQIRSKPLDTDRRVDEIRIGRAMMADVYRLDGTVFGADVCWDRDLGEWKVPVNAGVLDRDLFLFSEVYRPSIFAAGSWCSQPGGVDTTSFCAVVHDPTGGASLSVKGWPGGQFRFIQAGQDPGDWPELQVYSPGIELTDRTPWGNDIFLFMQSFVGRYESRDFILLADNGVGDNSPLTRSRCSDPWPFFATRPFKGPSVLDSPPERKEVELVPSFVPGGLRVALGSSSTFGMVIPPMIQAIETVMARLLAYGWCNTNVWQRSPGRITAIAAAYLPEKVPADFMVVMRDETGNVFRLENVFPDPGYPEVFWFTSSFDVSEGLLDKVFYTAEFDLIQVEAAHSPIPVR